MARCRRMWSGRRGRGRGRRLQSNTGNGEEQGGGAEKGVSKQVEQVGEEWSAAAEGGADGGGVVGAGVCRNAGAAKLCLQVKQTCLTKQLAAAAGGTEGGGVVGGSLQRNAGAEQHVSGDIRLDMWLKNIQHAGGWVGKGGEAQASAAAHGVKLR